jgi:hypothetical protein
LATPRMPSVPKSFFTSIDMSVRSQIFSDEFQDLGR